MATLTINTRHFWLCRECGAVNTIMEDNCRTPGCPGTLMPYNEPDINQVIQVLTDESLLHRYTQSSTPEFIDMWDLQPGTGLYSGSGMDDITSCILDNMLNETPKALKSRSTDLDLVTLAVDVTYAARETVWNKDNILLPTPIEARERAVRTAGAEGVPDVERYTPIHIAQELCKQYNIPFTDDDIEEAVDTEI